MILNSFKHIAETERKIVRNVLESSIKKYTVIQCSGNIGNMTCTIDTVKRNFRQSKKCTWNGTRLISYRWPQIII